MTRTRAAAEALKLLTDETVQELRDLNRLARRARGQTPPDAEERRASVELSRRLAVLVEAGVTDADLARALQVGPGTVWVRLWRHGYKPDSPRHAGRYKGKPGRAQKRPLDASGTGPVGHGGRDITGQRFWRLVAVERTGRSSGNLGVIWRFRCDCGNEIEKPGPQVRAGKPKDCGCGLGRQQR